MVRKRPLQNRRQFLFRLHDREQAFRNLVRPALASFGALRFADPLGDVIASRVVQFVILPAKCAIFAKNVLELIGNDYRPFFAVEFNLETSNTSLRGSRSLLHPLVD